MTNEKAIELLYDIQTDAVYNVLSDEKEALDMAIKALEKQPCEDAISRADVKKYLSAPDANGDRVIYESDLDLLPPITPQPKIGKWVAQDIHNCHTDFKCSACGYIHGFMHLYGKPTADYTYCPNCGARMIESEE